MRYPLVFCALVGVVDFVLPVTTGAEVAERSTTVADRELVNVTVYNGGAALVHDRRRIPLTQGLNRIAWRDVSANMDASSALLDTPDVPGAVHVVEQNFNFDLLTPDALLRHFVGQDVVVVHPRFSGEPEKRETARILSTNNGIVLQYRDRIETSVDGRILFPNFPKNFRDRPTLDLDVDSAHTGTQSLDLSYLTQGMNWRADYVAVLSPDEQHFSLNGLVTLSNTSGAAYEHAHLQLVAGNVNIVAPPELRVLGAVTARAQGSEFAPQGGFQQENYFEYHLYTLARPTTILDQQTKQLSLLTARNIPIHKTLELRGSPNYYFGAQQADLGDRLPVGVYETFKNHGTDLGIPLPGGVVRVYRNDARGLSQFLGSDQIEHTPADESVRLHLGDSFDVTAHKRQTDFKQVSNCTTDSSYEIVFANAKSLEQDVLAIEPIPGEWRILNENVPHSKSSSTTATWSVRVPGNGHATLTYTAETTSC